MSSKTNEFGGGELSAAFADGAARRASFDASFGEAVGVAIIFFAILLRGFDGPPPAVALRDEIAIWGEVSRLGRMPSEEIYIGIVLRAQLFTFDISVGFQLVQSGLTAGRIRHKEAAWQSRTQSLLGPHPS
jgi:hypothetical protein